MAIFEKLSDFFGFEESKGLNDETFGEYLKRIRLSREMTASELAEKADISQSYISQLENNVRLPSDKIIKKISYGLISKNNPIANYKELRFIDEKEKKGYETLITKLTKSRNYMKIKDIPTILEINENDELTVINKKEKEFFNMFRKLSDLEQDNLLLYMDFLLKKDRRGVDPNEQ